MSTGADGCSTVRETVAEYEVVGGIRFRFCRQCRVRNGAVPIQQAPGAATPSIAPGAVGDER